MTKITSVHFGDVHTGASNDPTQLKAEMDFVMQTIYKIGKNLNLITLTGDFFHKRLQLDSQPALVGFKFIYDLVEYCKKHSIKFRLIQGTITHDYSQLDIFESLQDDNIFKIIKTVQEEQLFDDVRVLYVPEEYPDNISEHYSKFIDLENPENSKNKYDLIFGHGTFKFQAHSSQIYESEKSVEKAPIFDQSKFINYFKGFCIFGHIHTQCNYKNKVFYHGSLSRNNHGEEKPKGFLVSSYDTADNSYKVVFVENKLAEKFKTLKWSEQFDNIDLSSVSTVIKLIDDTFTNFSNIRLVVDVDLSKELIDFIRRYYASNKNFSLLMKFVEISKKLLEKDNDEHVTELTEGDLIPDVDLVSGDPFAVISEFILQTHSQKISAEEVRNLVETGKK